MVRLPRRPRVELGAAPDAWRILTSSVHLYARFPGEFFQCSHPEFRGYDLGMNRFVFLRLALLTAMIFILTGCLYSRRPTAQTVRLRIDSQEPELYRIRLASPTPQEFTPDKDGRVSFILPPPRQGRDWFWFGAGQLTDGSGSRDPVIHVLKEGQIIRKLSLQDLRKLRVVPPADLLLKVS